MGSRALGPGGDAVLLATGAATPSRRSTVEPGGGAAPSEPPPIEVIDDDRFFDQTVGRVTIVDFWAPWCGPCRSFAPIFEQAALRHEGRIGFAKCNIDLSPRTAGLLQIHSIPTLVAFGSDGSELGRTAGVIPPRQLDAFIEGLAPAATA